MKNRSIGFRLAAWYSLVLACSLAAFSLAAWWAMRASVYHAIDDELRDRVRGVQKFMDQQISALSLPEIRDEFREHSVLGPGGDLFQVCDAQGQWLYRSVALENNNVPIEPPAHLPKPRFATLGIANRPLRFYSERIVVSGKPYTVQVAASMHEAFEAIEAFGITLAFAVPVLLVGASAGGYWISKRALDPVDGISRAAQRISIENLTERLSVPQTGDQLQRLTETLNQMFSRLEASVRQMKQFTADASHELRAPIALIRTTAEVAVQRRNRPPQEYLEALDDVLEESEQMSQVVNSLLLLARADAGKEHLEFAVIDAGAVAQGATDQGGRLARQKGIHFTVSLPDGPLPIRADGEALRRVLLILLDNAVKYTPLDGFVRVGVQAEHGIVTMSVQDTGIGIEPADLPHVFDRFWRADPARSREDSGTGLGLSIAKWIADQHGASLTMQSIIGQGSTFQLRIPLYQESNKK